MQCNIRHFEDRDANDVAAIARDAYKVNVDGASILDEAARHDPKCFNHFWVVEAGGRMIAYSHCIQYPGAFHPRKFEWEPGVLSAYRGRGIGSLMLRHLLEVMQPHDPIAFSAGSKENWPDGVAFLERRGFVETMRNFESTLALPMWDPQPFAGAVAAAKAQGYTFQTYAELAGAPDLDRRLHALVMELRRDVPSPETRTDIPLDVWIKSSLHRPAFLPDLYLVAFKDGEMVGMSNIWASDEGADILATGLTAVKREHRSRGLSKALKVQIMTAAKARGYRLLKTWNEVHNQRMLAVNAWLGFTRQPGWISYTLRLKAE